jgi:methylated-DNA-[protein]-cysteine S-methyltransferase
MISNFKRFEAYFNVFRTSSGWVGVAATSKGLCRVILPKVNKKQVLEVLLEEIYPIDGPEEAVKVAELSEKVLKRYFGKEPEKFKGIPLDLSEMTPFTGKVLKRVARIPYGRTMSYGEIARAVGNPKGARAVGGAVGRNPIPVIIPCHRVLAGDNRLGGFSGGLDKKIFLLKLENVDFNRNIK